MWSILGLRDRTPYISQDLGGACFAVSQDLNYVPSCPEDAGDHSLEIRAR